MAIWGSWPKAKAVTSLGCAPWVLCSLGFLSLLVFPTSKFPQQVAITSVPFITLGAFWRLGSPEDLSPYHLAHP